MYIPTRLGAPFQISKYAPAWKYLQCWINHVADVENATGLWPQGPSEVENNYATVPFGYNGMPQIHPKTAPSRSIITTPSNIPISQLTTLTVPNGIRIQSADLQQYTFQTDRPTDKWDWQQVCIECLHSVDSERQIEKSPK